MIWLITKIVFSLLLVVLACTALCLARRAIMKSWEQIITYILAGGIVGGIILIWQLPSP